jgi:hypothetical protein
LASLPDIPVYDPADTGSFVIDRLYGKAQNLGRLPGGKPVKEAGLEDRLSILPPGLRDDL